MEVEPEVQLQRVANVAESPHEDYHQRQLQSLEDIDRETGHSEGTVQIVEQVDGQQVKQRRGGGVVHKEREDISREETADLAEPNLEQLPTKIWLFK